MARMGIVLPSGFLPLRMARVASRPFITGICMSIRIMSQSPGCIGDAVDIGLTVRFQLVLHVDRAVEAGIGIHVEHDLRVVFVHNINQVLDAAAGCTDTNRLMDPVGYRGTCTARRRTAPAGRQGCRCSQQTV